MTPIDFVKDLSKISDITGSRVEQKLWKDKDGNYYISSIARLPDILYGSESYETMVFAADADGDVCNYTSLGCVQFADHQWALRAAELEWDIIDVESVSIAGELGKGD